MRLYHKGDVIFLAWLCRGLYVWVSAWLSALCLPSCGESTSCLLLAEVVGEFKFVYKMCKSLQYTYIEQSLILIHSHHLCSLLLFMSRAMPLVVLLVANITILICWTLIDPLVYKRFEMMPWSTYGRCAGSSNASNILLIIVGVLNAVVLLLALVQAWKARNISDEFSETKIVGSAVSHSHALLV